MSSGAANQFRRSCVPQVSKPAVSPTSKSAGGGHVERAGLANGQAGWEACDTADLEVCGTRRRAAAGFTLIEMILVMALLTVAVAFTAPALSRFFGGRTLDNEARRLLSVTRHGQGRAVSEGITVDLWLDAEHGTFGLEIEKSFDNNDPKSEKFELDQALRLEASARTSVTTSNSVSSTGNISVASLLKSAPVHPNLPTIRFQADGSIADNSPKSVRLIDRNGASIYVALAKNRMSYEIRNTEN